MYKSHNRIFRNEHKISSLVNVDIKGIFKQQKLPSVGLEPDDHWFKGPMPSLPGISCKSKTLRYLHMYAVMILVESFKSKK